MQKCSKKLNGTLSSPKNLRQKGDKGKSQDNNKIKDKAIGRENKLMSFYLKK